MVVYLIMLHLVFWYDIASRIKMSTAFLKTLLPKISRANLNLFPFGFTRILICMTQNIRIQDRIHQRRNDFANNLWICFPLKKFLKKKFLIMKKQKEEKKKGISFSPTHLKTSWKEKGEKSWKNYKERLTAPCWIDKRK